MFPRNSWYVAAPAHELGRTLLKRTIADEQLILYRTESGKPVAGDILIRANNSA